MGLWIIWFAIGICFLVLLLFWVLPKILLRMHAAAMPIRDRSLGRRREERGAVLFYEPASSVRPYIKSYEIITDSTGIYFKGYWARKVAYVKYELTVFDPANEIVQILRVKEKFNGGETTHVTKLPKNADFVSLRLLCVDDVPFPAERRRFHFGYALWLALFCFCLAFCVDLLLWLAGTALLRVLDGFTMTYSLPVTIWAEWLGITAAAVVVFTATLSLLRFFCLRRRRDTDES